ncbi:hypothetical protein PR048_002664 [Dryococelus australis]|uniref:Uncharacterized protein n=1 Tax=Dryococelus australis TaxID=614101 RepID=A0ABQ9IKV0_9NEOP|nr:hypothetical protein PR048_002664 [Dryococelus australis]
MLNRAKTDKVCNETCPVAGHEGLHDAFTFELDARVRTCARLVEDNDILGRLSAGDIVALEAKYHTSCLVQFYNKARKPKTGEFEPNNHEKSLHVFVLAELVMHTEEARANYETSPVSKLDDLADLYSNRLNQLGVQTVGRVHTTRLKQRVLAHLPDMRTYTKGRDTILEFNEDGGSSLMTVCEFDTGSDNDAVQLAHAALIVIRVMFREENPFTGFSPTCQQDSVQQLLLALVNMILDGTGINKDQVEDNSTAALKISHHLKFNSSCGGKKIHPLPSSYTDVTPVDNSFKKSNTLPASHVPLTRDGFVQHTHEEYLWLKTIYEELEDT